MYGMNEFQGDITCCIYAANSARHERESSIQNLQSRRSQSLHYFTRRGEILDKAEGGDESRIWKRNINYSLGAAAGIGTIA